MSTEAPPTLDLQALAAAEFHELKNQIGELALALDEVSSSLPVAATALASPRLNCRNIMGRLVEILTLYKSDRQELHLNVEAHSPAELVEELVADSRSLANGRLVIAGEMANAPPFAFFDRYLLQLAIYNAIHNALRYAKDRIEIGVEAADGGLRFWVQDDSEGFPPHILENQGHLPGRSNSGTGLGLFFAQTIARHHQNAGRSGQMTLENRHGARFSLWLP